MAPTGWLDIHGHFAVPQTEEVLQQQVEDFRRLDFMVTEPWTWSAEGVLPYLDRANVAMQMLSYIPRSLSNLRAANDYGASVVHAHPGRFGLLCALPTDDAETSLAEVRRAEHFTPPADGYALSTVYNGIWLSDERLEPLWEELDRRCAVCHVHPDATASGGQGRPSPLIEVAFDTARTITDMLYKGVFGRWPNIRFVFGHCGGALPVLAGRISLLGTEAWCPNPLELTRQQIETTLAGLYVDTAATAKTGLAPAISLVGPTHCIYGADCGVPCSTEATMAENQQDVLEVERKVLGQEGVIAANGWALFPAATKRAEASQLLN